MSDKTIVITMGDPSGIGPEVIVQSLLSPEINRQARFIIVGDSFVFKKAAGYDAIRRKEIEFVDLNNVVRKNFSFGKVKAEYGQAALEYIDAAVKLMKRQGIRALVTAPVSKESAALINKDFSGQTEYLAMLDHTKHFAMMLANDRLKISLVTRHIPLKDVAGKITLSNICQVISLTDRFLKDFYLIRKPNIAICSLNPHASDNGLIGQEENIKIVPAVNELKGSIRCFGPYPADSVFNLTLRGKFDAVVAMYHDQALIPLKITGSMSGLNITMGLSFIRISPLHGVAFDIAGKNKADASSMIRAINTAWTFLIQDLPCRQRGRFCRPSVGGVGQILPAKRAKSGLKNAA